MYSGMCTVLNVNAKDVRGHSRDELVGTTPRHCLPRHPAEGGLKGGGGLWLPSYLQRQTTRSHVLQPHRGKRFLILREPNPSTGGGKGASLGMEDGVA